MTELAPVVKESLNGMVERITFHNADTGFCVLRITAKSHKDLVTVIGHTPSINVGELIEAYGDWHHDRTYGIQFKALSLKVVIPTTLNGIEKYLGSGLIKGIGPYFAKQLTAKFGAEVLTIIENQPQRLQELEGIGQKRCDKIIQSWIEQKAIRKIMVFLQSYGVGSARAVRIYKTYGDAAIDTVTENPYRLAEDIHGIGFKTADTLAKQLGIPEDSLIRARAGVHYVIQKYCGDGHCGMPLLSLIQSSVELLAIPESTIKTAITGEIDANKMVSEKINLMNSETEAITEVICIFPITLHRAENGIARHIKRLLFGPIPWRTIEIEKAIPWVEEKTGLALSDSQKLAVKKALTSKIMILTGGPGVGKTTIVKSILTIIAAKDFKLTLCAPTGRAAKRLAESTGQPAKTIHRLLELRPGKENNRYDEKNPIDTDFVVVDEASMMDVSLMNSLLKAIPSHSGLLIVGDRDQLPSVGSGAVLADLIHSNQVPTARLTEIFRQSKISDIVLNAHKINEGKYPNIDKNKDTDFYFIEADTPEKTHHILLKLVTQRIPEAFKFNPFEDIQILTPMQRGLLGVKSLNADLQGLLNPSAQKISRFGLTFAAGDKVMQTINNYDKDVFNGDMGIIQSIDMDEAMLKINFDGNIIDYDFNELDEITLAYAVTIHKSQGSEYPAVIIPLVTQHYMMLERNLLYTAVTRGKQLVVIVGQKKALSIAIKNRKNRERITRLERYSQMLCINEV